MFKVSKFDINCGMEYRLLWSMVFIVFLTGLFLIVSGCSHQPKKDIVSEQYQYDNEGKLIEKVTPDGGKTIYEYNNQDLPIKIEYPDGFVKYGYDANSNRIWMQSRNGRTEYKYDAFDRLVEVVFKYSPEKKIIYGYDPWGRISNLKILAGGRVEYEVNYGYDLFGNLLSIDDGQGRIEYAYYPEEGKIVRLLPNGIKTTFSFSALGELTLLKHEDSSGRVIASYRYEYNPPGKVARVIEETQDGHKVTRYDWDSRGYLKALHLSDGNTVRYEYDAMGNRILEEGPNGTIRYEYDKFGRLTQAGDLRYEWDRNGNLISQIQKQSKTRIRYDGRNLPTLIRTPEATIHYGWDGDGNMISRGMKKAITYYLSDPLAPPGFTLAEFDKTGKLATAYLYGDVLLGQRDVKGKMQFFLEDGFNSIRHITDMNGKVVKRQDYTPFAEPIKRDGISNFRMAGERFLPEIKSYVIGGRLYEPNLGRYLTPDPVAGYMERFDSFNKYAHGCRDSMEPRCNQNRKQNILVGGVTARTGELARQAPTFGFDVGIGVNRNLDRLPALVRGIPDAIWAAQEQVTGGFLLPNTKMNLYNELLNRQHIETLEVHSHGAIAFGNLHREIDAALANGKLSIGKVIFAGAYPNEKMSDVLAKHGIPVETKTAMPYGSIAPYRGYYHDPVGVITMPNLKIGEILAPNAHPIAKWILGGLTKVGALSSALPGVPGPYSFEAHSLEYINKGKEKGEGGPFGTITHLYEQFLYDKDDQKKPFFPPDGGNGGGGFNDPFKSAENQVGGIELAATGEFVGIPGNITGAVFDTEKECLVLLSDNDLSVPSIKAEDLAVALLCADRGCTPQFTLDPADPKNPRGKWLKAVYIPEDVISGTPFGKTLFEADWLLKQYSFGVTIDENRDLQKRESSVAGFKSVADISLEQKGGYGKERWNRFWIVSDEMKLKQAGNSIYFDVAKMGVKSRKIVPDPSSRQGFKDVDTEEDPVATEFANLFTKLYDDLAKESPEFERVRQLAKAVALAKWLKEKNIPVDMDWVIKYVNKRIKTIDRITALSIQREKREEKPFSKGNRIGTLTTIQQLHLFGGVDLTVNPRYVSDDGTARSLQDVVRSKLRQKDASPLFSVEHNGRTLQAAVLPITRNGQEMWKNRRSTEINGVTYQVNDQGQVTKGIDRDGNVIEYGYDSDQRLKTVKVLNRNGWKIIGERNEDSSLWMLTNPRGNTLRYKYGSSGYLNEVEVDGHKWATYKYDQRQRETVVRYDGYAEKMVYDNNGNIRNYEVQTETASGPKIQRLTFDYNKSGNLTKVSGVGAPSANISYAEDDVRPAKITMPQAEIRYSYNPDGRIKEMTHSSGISATYGYEGDRLTKLQIDYQERQAEYLFGEDGLIQGRDLQGGIAKYGYTDGRLTSAALGQHGEAKYDYDDQSRLREIHFPDGNRIEYRYRGERGKKATPSQGQLLTVATHSSSPIKPKDIVPRERLKDDMEASKILKDSLIVDLFVEGKDSHLNIVNPQNEIHKTNLKAAKDLRRLVDVTTKTRGKLGKTLLKQWEDFYNTHLASLAKPTYWLSPDGKEVTLKPILIIKSNEVDYKYANLERVPVLADNFLIFIASKETSAKKLATKISNIPRLTKENVVFTIRLPEMSKEMQREWKEAITELEGIVGKENVLFDPSKEEFDRMLRNRDKEVVVIELTHTDKGIVLKDNEKYTSRDILQGNNLSHIKYLVAGTGTCNLPRLEKGNFVDALRKKSVGIMNVSYREVSADIGLKRLKELIHILKDIERYNLPAYHLFDIIDQLRKISKQGTTNIGKLDQPKDYRMG